MASQNALIQHGIITVLWLTFRYVFVQKIDRKIVPMTLKQRWKSHSHIGKQTKACCVNISEDAVRDKGFVHNATTYVCTSCRTWVSDFLSRLSAQLNVCNCPQVPELG